MSRASSSDAPVDLEKGLKAVATEEEEVEVEVDPCKAICIKATLGVLAVVHTLFIIGVIVRTAKLSDNWWDPWPIVVIFSPVFAWTFWTTPKVTDACIRKYAMKRTLASDSDISTKLLASKK